MGGKIMQRGRTTNAETRKKSKIMCDKMMDDKMMSEI